jgi:hypothetical protein
MYKIISIAVLCCVAFSSHAFQTRQEIVDSCTQKWLQMGGNIMVLKCIKMEIESQAEIEAMSKQ